MSHEQPVYASDLTDEQWALIEPLIAVYTWGRPRKLDMRRVVNAILSESRFIRESIDRN